MIRLVIADDHAIVREGLKRIVSGLSEAEVVAEADNGDEVVAVCKAATADVLLLDISMPGRPFLETLSRLKTELPDLRVLVLSMHPEDQYAVRVLKAGAAGYLSKGQDPETLAEAIRTVHSGHKYVSATLAEKLALRLEPAAPAEWCGISLGGIPMPLTAATCRELR